MTTSQVAIIFPALLFWIMLIVQYGLWFHAKQVAEAAAAEAVDAARPANATADDGTFAARALLDSSGNLANARIDVDRGAERVSVEVSGDAPQLVPGLDWSVTARADAAIERFIPEPDR